MYKIKEFKSIKNDDLWYRENECVASHQNLYTLDQLVR